MWEAIGDTLPLAIGLALSPFAVVTGIVLLLGERGRLKTFCFGLGWLLAIAGIAAVALWLVESAEDAYGDDAADAGVNVVQLLIGVLFLVLAFLSWRKRPRESEAGAPGEPEGRGKVKLLDRLDGLTAVGALGIGLAQGLLVIKNIPLAVGGGMRFGEAGLTGAAAITALLVFAVVASLGVLVPLVAALIGGPRFAPALRGMRSWTEANMTAISVVVLLLLAAVFLGQGLRILG